MDFNYLNLNWWVYQIFFHQQYGSKPSPKCTPNSFEPRMTALNLRHVSPPISNKIGPLLLCWVFDNASEVPFYPLVASWVNLIHISPIFRQQAILMGQKNCFFQQKKSGRIPLLKNHLGVTWDDHRTRGLDSGISWSKAGTFGTRFRCQKFYRKNTLEKHRKVEMSLKFWGSAFKIASFLKSSISISDVEGTWFGKLSLKGNF